MSCNLSYSMSRRLWIPHCPLNHAKLKSATIPHEILVSRVQLSQKDLTCDYRCKGIEALMYGVLLRGNDWYLLFQRYHVRSRLFTQPFFEIHSPSVSLCIKALFNYFDALGQVQTLLKSLSQNQALKYPSPKYGAATSLRWCVTHGYIYSKGRVVEEKSNIRRQESAEEVDNSHIFITTDLL